MSFASYTLLGALLSLACTLAASQSLPVLTQRQLAVYQLVNASRILAYYGIADDSPGHISMRDPLSPSTHFLITGASRTAAHISPADIAVVRINDSIVTSAALSGYTPPLRPAEVFIHSSIYTRFPDTTVSSIAFYRAEQLLPWSLFSTDTAANTSSNAAEDLTGFYAATSGTAFMGGYPAPVFDVFDAEPGTASVVVDNTVKSYELAQKFGPSGASGQTVNQTNGFRPLVLMRNDGATVVGTSVPETVFRFVQAAKSARVQYHSSLLASQNGITPNFVPTGATKTKDDYLRSWLLWMSQIEASINADTARSPELWKSSDDASSGTKSKNKATTQRPLSVSVSMLAICVAYLHMLLSTI